MRVRASVRAWGDRSVIVQEARSWRVLEWPSAAVVADGVGTLVPGADSTWAVLSDGELALADGRRVRMPGEVSEALWDGPDAFLVIVDGDLWRIGESGERRLATGGVRHPRILGDQVTFEREWSSGPPGVVLDAPDVRRTFTVGRAGGRERDLAPDVPGWIRGIVPGPHHGGHVAFEHTDLPGPYTQRIGLLNSGAPWFPFPEGIDRLPGDPVWNSGGSILAVQGMEGIRRGVVSCSPQLRTWDWLLPPDGVHTSPALPADGSLLSVWQDLGTVPAIGHSTRRGTTRWARLEESPEWWPRSRTQLYRWRSGADRIEGLLATPPGPGPFPTVVDLHGGPDGMTLHASLSSFAVPLTDWVDEGFAVFAPDYRDGGIVGLAAKRAAGRMEPGARASHDDVIAGVDSLVTDGIIDPQRLYLFGFSMGGLVGGHVIARDDRIRAAAFWDPVVDFATVDNAIARRQLGGAPSEVPQVWERTSLLPLARQTRTPVLIMSSGDQGRPPQRSRARWHALLPTSRHLAFVDEAHGPSSEMREGIVRRTTAWFSETVA